MNLHEHHRRMIAIAATATLGILVPTTAPIAAQEDGCHILLSNDDGVRAPGILALARTLADVGVVHLIAPCDQRSGSSMAVALRDEYALAPEGEFDLVVSGINAGANVGEASHLSGTVGAARAGDMRGIPALAASAGTRIDLDYAARFVARFASEARRRGPTPGIVYSINVPRSTEAETRGVAVRPMLGMQFTIGFAEEGDGEDGSRRFRTEVGLTKEAPPGGDTEAFTDGWITITPCDSTGRPMRCSTTFGGGG